MYYIYRFIDKKKNIIYVGKSKQELEQRFRGHTHLPDECYSSVHKIEYITCSTETDMSIKEIYYINKYKNENGYFNLLDLSELPKSVDFNDKWKMYRGPLPKHFSRSLNVKNNYSKEKATRYNSDGSIDRRQPHKPSGKSSYVEALNKDEINKIIEHLIMRINTAPTDTKKFVWFRNLMFFVLCMNLPLKTEDLLMLKYKDIFNKKNQIIPVEFKLSRFHKDEILNIPLRNICKQILYKYCELLNLNYANNAEDYLFKSREGDGPVSSRSIWRIISESTAEVGIKKMLEPKHFVNHMDLMFIKLQETKLKHFNFLVKFGGVKENHS